MSQNGNWRWKWRMSCFWPSSSGGDAATHRPRGVFTGWQWQTTKLVYLYLFILKISYTSSQITREHRGLLCNTFLYILMLCGSCDTLSKLVVYTGKRRCCFLEVLLARSRDWHRFLPDAPFLAPHRGASAAGATFGVGGAHHDNQP